SCPGQVFPVRYAIPIHTSCFWPNTAGAMFALGASIRGKWTRLIAIHFASKDVWEGKPCLK
ncbi:MAG: hypothetical protein ACFE8Z_11370, partial [Candidatus Hermodarchaeota archaeon]